MALGPLSRCSAICCLSQVAKEPVEEFDIAGDQYCWRPESGLCLRDGSPPILEQVRSGAGERPGVDLPPEEHVDPSELQERGRTRTDDGAFYTGQWHRERRHGTGKIERRGVGVYEGQFSGNRACGSGRFSKLNGDVYEGQWYNDRAHGQGTYFHADGSSYQGQWAEDLKDGMGVETWLDGSFFEGGYLRGKKHGRGVYRSADESQFEGQFRNDHMDGEGQYIFPDGRIYVGHWSESRMCGEGRMVWPNGQRYQGQYDEDKRWGEGTFTWPDGRCYVGLWARGKQHGHGTYTDARGRTWTGEWRNGQKVRPNAGSSASSDTGSVGRLSSSDGAPHGPPGRAPSSIGGGSRSSAHSGSPLLGRPLGERPLYSNLSEISHGSHDGLRRFEDDMRGLGPPRSHHQDGFGPVFFGVSMHER